MGGKNLQVAREILSPDIAIHSNYLQVHGIDEWERTIYEAVSQGVSELRVQIEQLLAKGDSVIARCQFKGRHTGELFGVQPSGEKIEFNGIIWAELIEETIVEIWNSLDFDNLIRVLGAEVKALKGILPICAACKKVRDDKGYWNRIEAYIEIHSEALFSHGICLECAENLYGDEDWYRQNKKDTHDRVP